MLAGGLLVIALCASQPTGWSAVVALPPGARMEIEERARVIWEGTLHAADDDAVVLDHDHERFVIARTSIVRVVRLGARKTEQYAKRGFLIGFAVGVAQVLLGVQSNRGSFLLLYPPIGGAVGAAIGAVDGSQLRERAIVYEATTPDR